MPDRSIDRWREELQRGLGLTPPGDRRAETRANLVAEIPRLAIALDVGDVEPVVAELRLIARLCDDHQLPTEAARIRRWIGET